MTDQSDVQSTDAARRIIEANSYLVLATVDESGHPWATPVWFAAVGREQFFWVSRADARHSRNISRSPAVGIVIFDSSVPAGHAEAAYFEAEAEEVAADDRAHALGVYDTRSLAQGIRAWTEGDVTGEAPHRLYRATVSQVSLLEGGDHRVPLSS
jgi:nitroimidazol reductase NimA-like FMN-containing flavoprotein (pyridoxamine 5'-phosphate oxidase superfamily)